MKTDMLNSRPTLLNGVWNSSTEEQVYLYPSEVSHQLEYLEGLQSEQVSSSPEIQDPTANSLNTEIISFELGSLEYNVMQCKHFISL
jgi:hypothetical protein